MGLLKDALNLGYITLDQYEDLASDWQDIGYNARHYGDAESFQGMTDDLLDWGFYDLADQAYIQFDNAVTYYTDLYEGTIYYNSSDKRWHDSDTHRYVKDPYEWISD